MAKMYAVYPNTYLYGKRSGAKKDRIKELLWGDRILPRDDGDGGWRRVYARGTEGWVREEETQSDPVLEVIFVDVGQGDGCLLVTPKDKHIIIDAGKGEHMFRFLRWRYWNVRRKPWRFEAGVISHPDDDHYKGFNHFFEDEFPEAENFTFDTLYHNGIMEQKGANSPLGKRTNGKPKLLTDLLQTKKDMTDFLQETQRWKGKHYATMLNKASESKRVKDFRMLSTDDGYLKGYEEGKDLSIEVLGPVPDQASEEMRLPWLSSAGKTKNGHSVVLKLRYKDVSVLLGGDLNIKAEDRLLEHYTGLDPTPNSAEDERVLVEAARQVFQVDVAKSCHHGSADFRDVFLQAVNPLVTVISSGDDESFSHPRADALGAIGKRGRGERPLIFNTELARSTKEGAKHTHKHSEEVAELKEKIEEAEKAGAVEEIQKLQKELAEKEITADWSVAVYGSIYLRTDGEKVVMAQKLERPKKSQNWDLYKLESEGLGGLRYQSKH
jgi:beta-lactamase superfamily II metal-dependent hydrolase